ncbi:unnamed protein product [Phaedon cochleariae]|uniref:C2H2-type domain-containing protein n=1 Tax=Phaedon cochleariae TaxID=80249 RepID=A0A9N9X1W1_PHACE|nr:unnamed protein product [Phaedon cochleariae]
MDYSEDGTDDFHRSLEPMVIINDEESIEQEELKADESDPLATGDPAEDDLINSIGPEISIIPVKRKRSQYKMNIFEREYSPSCDGTFEVHGIIRPSREKVRRISVDEAQNAADTYARRKSNPLEKCPVCKKYFRRLKTHLIKHDMIMRSPEEILFCTLCQKSFNSQSNLAIHMRTHNGMRPYICEVCQKTFSQSCNLVNHMRVHTVQFHQKVLPPLACQEGS